MNSSKTCPRCKESKPAADFYRDNHQLDRLSAYCKPCHCARQRTTYRQDVLDPVKHARRLASHRRYSKTAKGRAAHRRANDRYLAKHTPTR